MFPELWDRIFELLDDSQALRKSKLKVDDTVARRSIPSHWPWLFFIQT